MRWLAYLILAYLVLGTQVGLGPVGPGPNLMVLAAIFIAIYAPRRTALMGCFGLGLMQDLMTASPLGLWAIAYAIVGLLVIGVRDMVYREHFLTHAVLGFLGALTGALVLLGHGRLYQSLHPDWHYRGPLAWPLLRSAGYTALLAPFVLGGLRRTKQYFGFRVPRRGSVRTLRRRDI